MRRSERRRSSIKAARTPQNGIVEAPSRYTPPSTRAIAQVKQLPSSISESVRKLLFPLLNFDN